MARNVAGVRLRVLVVALALAAWSCLLSLAPFEPTAVGAEARMHDLQWNVCDQYGNSAASDICEDWTPSQKAAQIELLVEASDWRGQALTVQEICKSTFDLALSRLGAPWTGYFATTVLFSNDTRCRDIGKRNWGIGVLVKGKIRGYDNQYIGNDPDDGEVRRFCAVTLPLVLVSASALPTLRR